MMLGLASFFKGTSITVLDPFLGFLRIDLGDYLLDYTQNSLMKPEFSMERITDPHAAFDQHSRAGMLGTYGNIVLSTFLHGLVLSTIVGSDHNCTCVGDDAFGRGYKMEWEGSTVLEPVRLIGEIHDEKLFIWEHPTPYGASNGYAFLKRPVDVYEGGIMVGVLLDFPVLAIIIGEAVQGRTVTMGTSFNRQKTFLTQFHRLIQRLHHIDSIPDEDFSFLDRFSRFAYGRLGLPTNGSLPPHRDRTLPKMTIFPIKNCRDLVRDHMQSLYDSVPLGEPFEMPICKERQEISTEPLYTGEERIGQLRKVENLLETLGYLEVERLGDETFLWNRTSAEWLRRFLDHEILPMYHIHVVRDPPDWYYDSFSIASWPVDYFDFWNAYDSDDTL
jgi:hypothetical protein